MSPCEHLEQATLVAPRASQSVYKDECCTCFYSQDSQLGIDVCLHCFQAGCLAPTREHAAGHHQLSGHTIALNIQRRERPKVEQAPATKVAIAAETNADRYSYEMCLRCYTCECTTDQVSANLQSVVDGVKNALSSVQQSEVKAWEQEMTACEHTLTLQQEPAKALEDSSLATCSDCTLSENLWLCLVCGKLSCGRQQFGGGGGNGHGLQHVDSSGHALAVKLGSITPEGTADVYCYSCDEERLDPMLEQHLSHWGIHLHGRVKTEKSLQELQVEQNLKWDFSMQTDDGKDMTPLSGPGLTGMKNIGNSCYLASIAQCLFSLPLFEERFLVPFKQDVSKVVPDPASSLEVQMRKLADGLLSGDFAVQQKRGDETYQLGIAPTMLKSLIGKGHVEFSTMRQQDAFEFLIYLCEKLDKLQTPEGFRNPTDAFKFRTEQRTQCKACNKVAYKVEAQEHISVLVPARPVAGEEKQYEPVQMKELLDIYTRAEEVEWTCPACESKAGATKQTLFKTFPQVLVINPGRFALDNWVPSKLEIAVVMPDSLSMEGYKSIGQQPDEELLPDNAPATKRASPEHVDALMAMGFPKVRCEKALLTTGGGTEEAMEWLFAHMEDIDIDVPYVAPTTTTQADEGLVSQLVDMGFPKHLCVRGAVATGNANAEAALEWIMSHMDDPEEPESKPEPTTETEDVAMEETGPVEYTCKALACHKGSSVHAGHYVAFVKKQVDGQSDWVLFNDEKVVRGVAWEEAQRTAHVYFLVRS
ncbi:hypothetical protein BCR37DRAFT_397685 [Protomyces lactucae-debilis]|uniref:ubiquitinyl hydrolase 1 n=1 Tax=Protomyces lactucae-debilis TaxID=2754530 RepID=A0A1Y2FLP7_PROLT|nr:uncharacterized protein BCR37DRAFT_397685 [Protomyces lactucae-debilis]ORY84284.1 hypothetical protein BCR37DRAFT_397685 [Protomyces lactucae-debilis]